MTSIITKIGNENVDPFLRMINHAETAQQAIKDFLHAVDRGYLGQMPAGFNESAFVKALWAQVQK
jgi:hypothetical protein